MTTPAKSTVPVEQRLANIEEAIGKLIDIVADQGKNLEAVKTTATAGVKKGMFGGKRERVAIKDNKTGAVYPSQAAVTKALAPEFGLDQLDHFACYKIFAKAPDRFVRLTGADADAVWKAEDEKIAKEVEEANKKLAAEQALTDAKTQADAKAQAAKTQQPAQQPKKK